MGIKMQYLKNSCRERFAQVADALAELNEDTEKKRIIVAVDGKCAGGKSTLGAYLQELFDANLFHMDDFFLQAHQRTEERLAEIGGNVDYERFSAEVVKPLLAGQEIHYRRFDCQKMMITEEIIIPAKRINIIEGSYCRNLYFGEIYDLKVFIDIDKATQLENIRRRNGADRLEIFQKLWIPKEEAYFEKFHVKETSDIVVNWHYASFNGFQCPRR